jgi:peroxiredoxin Q/BCP
MNRPVLAAVRNWICALTIALVGLGSTPPARAADSPQPGSPAPAFALPDQSGVVRRLGDYKGQWVVLYFYPKDGTPGCTTEACEFRDNIFAFRDLGAVVLGISLDDVDSHARFAKDQHLPFPLLADASKDTARQYGVLSGLLGMINYSKRETFLIDPKGRIAKHYADVDPKSHSKTVLEDLKALKAATG